MDVIFIAMFAVIGIVFLVFIFLAIWIVKPWLRSFLSGGKIALFQIVGMRLRRSPVDMLIDAYITFVQRGEPIRMNVIESHYIAHQNRIHSTNDLIDSLEKSRKAN